MKEKKAEWRVDFINTLCSVFNPSSTNTNFLNNLTKWLIPISLVMS